MHTPMAELADRYTILKIKCDHGVVINEDLLRYESELRGIDTNELHKINLVMWYLEELISDTSDPYMIGVIYLVLRSLTKKRVQAKNKISKACGDPQEVKSY